MSSALSTQCAQIRAHLESGRGITQADAIDLYGCFRLGARIHDLRQEGLDIVTTTRTAKKPLRQARVVCRVSAGRHAMSWKTFDEPLPLGKQFVALYADGSGGQVFYRALDGGLIDDEGEELFVSDSEMDDWLMESDYPFLTVIDEFWHAFDEPLPVDVPFIAVRNNPAEANGYVVLPDEREGGILHLVDAEGWPLGEFTKQGVADCLVDKGYVIWLPYPDGLEIWCRRGGGGEV